MVHLSAFVTKKVGHIFFLNFTFNENFTSPSSFEAPKFISIRFLPDSYKAFDTDPQSTWSYPISIRAYERI